MSVPAHPTAEFDARSIDDMRGTRAGPADDWLWQGYLLRGAVTLLTSQWKTGKTTLVSVLLAKLGQGGTFLNLPLRPGRAVVVSEEAEANWLARADELRFGPHVRWLCRPFQGRPRAEDWSDLIDYLLRLHQDSALDLVVIDPLASFQPGRTENDAGTMMDVLLPLQRLTTRGISVLVLHHPKKGESAPGQAARGSGALTGFVDVLIEMTWHAAAQDDDRRRRLLAFSRRDQTPRRLLIELTADKTDYVVHGDFTPDDFAADWPVLLGVLEDSSYKIKRDDILKIWPADYPKPTAMTLWRWLDRAVKEGRVLREGSGRRNSPFKYWLPGQEEKWAADPYRLPDLPDLPPVVLNPAALLRAAGHVLKQSALVEDDEEE